MRRELGRLRTCAAVVVAAGLWAPAPAPAAEPIRSTFDRDDEGWRVVGDTRSTVPEWRSTGGNPGGFVRTHDVVIGGVMYWSAPPRFRGDVSTSYGMRLQFDLRQSVSTEQFDAHDVRLVSPGLTLGFDHSPNPAVTSFTRYSIPLHESAGWYHVTNPRTPATRADLLRVLGDLTALEIRAEFRTGPDSDDLDNVVLEVESDPPETTLDEAPDDPSPSSSARFAFSADEERARFECSLDGAAFAACSSPHAVDALPDGRHRFAVRAVDRAGNVDATPADHAWTVDTQPPDAAVTGPSAAHGRDVTFGFTADEDGARFLCALDAEALAACTSPHTEEDLAEGEHTFTVQAVDRAGNADPTPTEHAFRFDRCDVLHEHLLPEAPHVCL